MGLKIPMGVRINISERGKRSNVVFIRIGEELERLEPWDVRNLVTLLFRNRPRVMDANILLKTTPAVMLNRVRGRGGIEKDVDSEYLLRVQEGMNLMFRNTKFHIDGDSTPAEVTRDLVAWLNKLVKQHPDRRVFNLTLEGAIGSGKTTQDDRTFAANNNKPQSCGKCDAQCRQHQRCHARQRVLPRESRRESRLPDQLVKRDRGFPDQQQKDTK